MLNAASEKVVSSCTMSGQLLIIVEIVIIMHVYIIYISLNALGMNCPVYCIILISL